MKSRTEQRQTYALHSFFHKQVTQQCLQQTGAKALSDFGALVSK